MANAPTLLLCDCTGTMKPDAAAIEKGCGLSCSKVHTFLCRDEAAHAANALEAGPVLIACGQEAGAFLELAEDLGVSQNLACVDIRDRAGWSDDPSSGPKMAALIAESRLAAPMVPGMEIQSEGVCLVYGRSDVALAAGARLAGTLTVTVILTGDDEVIPPDADLDIVRGRISAASGGLGAFEITVDGFAEMRPAGRGARAFGAKRDGAKSECDLIVDLSGGQPMFPAHHKRDGYFRADPGDPLAVERLLFDAMQMTGQFEKPFYIRFDESLCAHSRAGQKGCNRCLDICPTSAISPGKEAVVIDPLICAGCGACAAVCPSGAASADDPPVQHIFARIRTMAEAYRKAGGKAPRLLVHDDHGAEMIRLAARYGRGLPADVIPLEVSAMSAFGHAEQLAALAVGFVGVDILAGPRTEREVIESQIAVTDAIGAGTKAGAGRVRLIDPAEPDALSEMLYGTAPAALVVEPILPLGGRRDVTRLAATALAGGTAPEQPIALPDGAPYGAVVVDTGKCTLCLSCISLCPSGALGDNPDRPEVNFREEACLQCGICRSTCPEQAITLAPQLDLRASALSDRELHGEEPFCCIECGKPFGVKSTIDRITEKLSGVHSMFTNSDNAKLIQMCDDCRVRAQFKAEDNPFQMGERPRVRTTEDYLKDDD